MFSLGRKTHFDVWRHVWCLELNFSGFRSPWLWRYSTEKSLWGCKQSIWFYFFQLRTSWTYIKCSFIVVLCFASLMSLILSWCHNLISPHSRHLSHSWRAEICFSLLLLRAHCFGLKALLIWLTLIILLSIFSSRRQLFVINPAHAVSTTHRLTAELDLTAGHLKITQISKSRFIYGFIKGL